MTNFSFFTHSKKKIDEFQNEIPEMFEAHEKKFLTQIHELIEK